VSGPARRAVARELAALCLILGPAGSTVSCDGTSRERTERSAPAVDELDGLRAQVSALGDSVAVVLAGSPAASLAAEDTSDVIVAIRTDLVRNLVARASASYLKDVQLHLAPDAQVDVGDEVRVKLGLFNVYAGKWRLKANIRKINTSLRVQEIGLVPADSNRFEMSVPVEVSRGEGEAEIDFTWDSATMASVVCSDFEVHDSFAGVVQPRLYEMPGTVRFLADADGVAAIPEFTEQIDVRPEPTEESWAKIREMLERQNSIFKCGIAIQPEKMEGLLRALLRKGFSFRLPRSIMKPIPLPAAVRKDVRVGEKTISVAANPSLLHLSPDWLWYGMHVSVEPGATLSDGGATGPGTDHDDSRR
jgi:hypothetical protein